MNKRGPIVLYKDHGIYIVWSDGLDIGEFRQGEDELYQFYPSGQPINQHTLPRLNRILDRFNSTGGVELREGVGW